MPVRDIVGDGYIVAETIRIVIEPEKNGGIRVVLGIVMSLWRPEIVGRDRPGIDALSPKGCTKPVEITAADGQVGNELILLAQKEQSACLSRDHPMGILEREIFDGKVRAGTISQNKEQHGTLVETGGDHAGVAVAIDRDSLETIRKHG